MKNVLRKVSASAFGLLTVLLSTMPVFAEEVAEQTSVLGDKAMASGIGIGIAAGLAAIGMGYAIGKSSEGVSRQPEASGKIQTLLMLGLVFIETAIIYALIVAILIIFVL